MAIGGGTFRYWLTPHVYVCRTDDHAVLLDLKNNKYVGVPEEQSTVLEGLVYGWPCMAANRHLLDPGGGYEEFIREMTLRAWLTDRASAGKSATPASIARPKVALIEGYSAPRVHVSWRIAARFTYASLAAQCALKWRSLERVFEGVHARRLRTAGRPVSNAAARAVELVAVFQRCLPLFGGSQTACLPNSLALLNFLAYYGLYPQCVVGVMTRPFGAHAWVQLDDVVFNDTPEHVRRYTPIMVV